MKALQYLAKAWRRQPSGPIEPAPLAVAPVQVATIQAEAAAQPLDLDAAAKRLGPFIERTRAELAGAYVLPLPWPVGGALVHDPGAHWCAHGGRLEGIADVLRPLAEAWAAGDRPIAEGWPAAPGLYQWEYSRLVAWFKADPCEVPAQVEAWAGSVTTSPNPIANLAALSLVMREHQVSDLDPLPWGGRVADLAAWALGLDAGALPAAPWELRPGVTVTDGARWLEQLQVAIAQGPITPRARTGAVQRDLESLTALLTANP
ncbi:hypothetical protein D3C72_859930 [compost metagenome]